MADGIQRESGRTRGTLGQRIVVIGTAGSGKSSLARHIGEQLGAPVIELDSLYWGPGWKRTPRKLFRKRLQDRVEAESWVVDGDYSAARDIIWSKADTLIWLDFPLRLLLWRLAVRTWKRVVNRVELWNGNREIGPERLRATLQSTAGEEDWALSAHEKRRARYPRLFSQYPHLRIIRFRSPARLEDWLGRRSRRVQRQEEAA